MNKLTNNIPNKIKQPAQCCIHCGKSYIKRINLNKHVIICELLHKRNSSSLVIEDDEEPIPSQRKMFQMLIELGQKYNKLDEKVEELNKWVVKKKKKINILEWLNDNITPNILFDSLIDKIIVNEDDIKYLFENTFNDVLNEIFLRTIYNFNETENPIFAFVQKANVFYIYESVEDKKMWVELSRENLIKFLNKVHIKILKAFCQFKQERLDEIRGSDNYSIKCDKTMVKIMSVEFKQESILSKVKSMMFAKMKTDMKALVEFEFEF
jgi:uncharacterized protein YeeX (DUF496 family)